MEDRLRLDQWRPAGGGLRIEADLIPRAAAADAALALKAKSFRRARSSVTRAGVRNDRICEIFPAARQIAYAEYFYRSVGGDVGFDVIQPAAYREARTSSMPRMPEWLAAVRPGRSTPTPFQASLLPDMFCARTHVIHEGVDTATIRRHAKPRQARQMAR